MKLLHGLLLSFCAGLLSVTSLTVNAKILNLKNHKWLTRLPPEMKESVLLLVNSGLAKISEDESGLVLDEELKGFAFIELETEFGLVKTIDLNKLEVLLARSETMTLTC